MFLQNSLTGNKEPLQMMQEGRLSLYVCGLTVYDKAHIGHLRCMLVFDLLVRFMQSRHIDVTYVRNITDVDDKIIHRAQEENISIEALTSRVISEIASQEEALGLVKPKYEPRASEYIQSMIDMIAKLEQEGYAYIAENKDVCFDVSKFKDYGMLSGQKLEALIDAHRISDKGKRSAQDFVLWKQCKPDEPSWPSPWGAGRPGWHIECSAMSTDILGDTFDLHGGGVDLKFPHHENEIAQSVCATGGKFANHWMHVGHLHVNGEKMSKSLGNFVTLEEALLKYHPEVLKLFLLKTHYRQPFNYNEQGVIEAQTVLLGFYLAIWQNERGVLQEDDPHWQAFCEALEDDLNVAKALAVMHKVASEISQGAQNKDLVACLINMGHVFGILKQEAGAFLQGHPDAESIDAMVQSRQEARVSRNFQEADAIRDKLADMSIIVEDSASGTRWYYGKSGLS